MAPREPWEARGGVGGAAGGEGDPSGIEASDAVSPPWVIAGRGLFDWWTLGAPRATREHVWRP